MKLADFRVRDPFIVPVADERTYYLYGSTDANSWGGKAVGFDVYCSTDLENWSGPFAVFRPGKDFWSDRQFWAPEVHYYQGHYYMFASFKSEDRCRGTQILVADSPRGPFLPHSDGPVTPASWESLDGTFYVDMHGDPWMVFCHEWVQVHDGEICAMRLSAELDCAVGTPECLFRASSAPWGRRGTDYVTDGPFLHRLESGKLVMMWSSFGAGGYAIGIAHSLSGEINGPWQQEEQPLYARDGGHGMLFRAFDGRMYLTIHTPNTTPQERAILLPVCESNETLQVTEESTATTIVS